MKALLQRVSSASVRIDGILHSEIQQGLLIFLGVKNGDSDADAHYLAEKCAASRIMEDHDGKMNVSVKESGGSVLIVSQFTLYADTRKGNRPGFTDSAPPLIAEQLYDVFIHSMKNILGDNRVAAGVFRAMMDIELVNSGPVTIMIESKQ